MKTTKLPPRHELSAAALAMLEAPEGTAEPPIAGQTATERTYTPEELAEFVRDTVVAHSVGEMLARARKGRHLSLRALAARLGDSHSRVVALEKATSRVEVQTVARFADALGYDLRLELVPRDGSEPIATEVRKAG